MSMRTQWMLVGLLSVAVVISGIAVVHAKYRSRQLFIQTNQQRAEMDEINIEWKRLLLEQATWGAPHRIEIDARKKLKMRLPQADEIIVVWSRDGT